MFVEGEIIVVCTDTTDISTVLKAKFVKYAKEGSLTYVVAIPINTTQSEYFFDSLAWKSIYYEEVKTIVTKRYALKKYYEDSIRMIYDLNSKQNLTN